MANVHFTIDRKKLEQLAFNSDGAYQLVSEATQSTARKANTLGAGYRTPKWHDHKTGETKGGKKPNYIPSPKRTKKGARGIVYTGNYAAMKDNIEHNTLLKSL
jgi:hypothetical protein